ncbi:DUF2637 domain-containing protein [Paeniglutamicibacter sp.]|uniref:DUF2637 domain-containing protein n=1 Tax=Paeniglutamicibacter sp. TaxID=1934391 RepID=UPI00398A479B
MNPIIIRRAMLTVVWIVALTAGVLSYAGIRELALLADFSPSLSWLLPIILDGLVVAGALVVLDAEAKQTSRKFGWTLTLTGVAASVAANITVAEGPIAMIAHSAPPLILALTLEAWLATMRSTVRATQRTEQENARAAAVKEAAEAKAAARATRTLGTARAPAPVEDIVDQVLALKAEGFSNQAIAEQLNTNKSRVQRIITRHQPAGADPAWVAEGGGEKLGLAAAQ